MNKLALNIPSAMALNATSQSLQIEYNPLPLLSIGQTMQFCMQRRGARKIRDKCK